MDQGEMECLKDMQECQDHVKEPGRKTRRLFTYAVTKELQVVD